MADRPGTGRHLKPSKIFVVSGLVWLGRVKDDDINCAPDYAHDQFYAHVLTTICYRCLVDLVGRQSCRDTSLDTFVDNLLSCFCHSYMATGSIQLFPYPDAAPHYSDSDDEAVYSSPASTNSWRARFIRAFRGHDYSPLSPLPRTSISPKKPRLWILALIWVPIGVAAVMGMLYLIFPTSRYHYDYLSLPLCHANVSRRPSIDLKQWQAKYSPSALCTPTNQHSIPELTYSHSSTYDKFTSHRDATPTRFSLLPVTPIPGVCLEDYFSGQPCSCMGYENKTTPEPMDIVWAWVNGSDPLHIKALEETQLVNGYGTPKPKLYRCVATFFSFRPLQLIGQKRSQRVEILHAFCPRPFSKRSWLISFVDV